jgi:probable HAF family extracellular repeat protein
MSVRTIAFALFALSGACVQAQLFVTDLGALTPGSSSYGYKINDSGMVVGFSMTPSGARGFAWTRQNGMTNLGVLRQDLSSFATSLDNTGRVVGYSGSGSFRTGYAWTASDGLVDLGTFGSDPMSLAIDTNDLGQTVGVSGSDQGTKRAFVHGPSGMTDLGPVPGKTSSFGRGINAGGYVVGHSAGGDPRAFLWRPGIGMSALSNLSGGATSEAFEISDAGRIVGSAADSAGTKHAVSWTGPTGAPVRLDLGVVGHSGTEALDVNEQGVAVGYGLFNGQERALVYHPTLGAVRLDAMLGQAATGWTFLRANGINESGEIVGTGILDGVTRGFVVSPVPEPATSLALLAGLGALIARRRKITG